MTVRFTADERADLKARAVAEGVTLSAYIRRTVLGYSATDPLERLEALERRVERLEEMAGL